MLNVNINFQNFDKPQLVLRKQITKEIRIITIKKKEKKLF